jgi:hypothetical protein
MNCTEHTDHGNVTPTGIWILGNISAITGALIYSGKQKLNCVQIELRARKLGA